MPFYEWGFDISSEHDNSYRASTVLCQTHKCMAWKWNTVTTNVKVGKDIFGFDKYKEIKSTDSGYCIKLRGE